MWTIAIPALCLIAHLYLVVIFLPGFWREIDERGFRWHTAISLFVVPALLVSLIANHVLPNLSNLPGWQLVVAFITIDAFVVAMVLAAVGLRRRRKRVG